MTSEELADQVTACVESLRSRIIGTGQEQYSDGDTQAIERKTNEQLIQETLEELQDGLVYLAVLHARFATLGDKIKGNE